MFSAVASVPRIFTAVDAWISKGSKGSVIYSSGTGKTEIAFECARKTAASIAAITTTEKKGCISNLSSSFNILYLVPRIVLINQNYKRLLKYGIPEERIGVYFGQRKDIREITISTYHSIITNLDLIHRSDMVVFDEVHLISDTAKSFSKIFDVVVEDHSKAILGLTATIDDEDTRYSTILTVLPPVKKYMIKDAIKDGRLAGPIVIPLKVKFTDKEQKVYDACSIKIKNISNRFKRYDIKAMSLLLKKGGYMLYMFQILRTTIY